MATESLLSSTTSPDRIRQKLGSMISHLSPRSAANNISPGTRSKSASSAPCARRTACDMSMDGQTRQGCPARAEMLSAFFRVAASDKYQASTPCSRQYLPKIESSQANVQPQIELRHHTDILPVSGPWQNISFAIKMIAKDGFSLEWQTWFLF